MSLATSQLEEHPAAEAPVAFLAVDAKVPADSLWITGTGQVLAIGTQAQHVLRQPDCPLHVQAGALRWPRQPVALDDAIQASRPQRPQRPVMLAVQREGRSPLVLAISPHPVSREAAGAGPRLRVQLHDPDLVEPDDAHLVQLFGLSLAEARVVKGLATGRDVPSISAELGVQPNTVHAHIKRALAKTGTRRQAEMVSLILRCLPRT